jgi:hypothetical protein
MTTEHKPQISPQARELYKAGVDYLVSKGARREEFGSGWWYCDEMPNEMGFGEAVEFFLMREGLDLRDEILGEPGEFWG